MSLEHLVSVQDYLPTVLKGVKEIDALVKSEDYLFDILVSIVDKEYARMFIQTSDEVGVTRFEQLVGIVADPTTETLDFRKERLLTRTNATLPYSTIWLRVYLNGILGPQNYELTIDYKQDIIRLNSYLLDYSWAREATTVIRDIKPCNMIFQNIPTIKEYVGLMYWLDENTWNSDIWDDNNTWGSRTIISEEQLPNYELIINNPEDLYVLAKDITGVILNNTHITTDIFTNVVNSEVHIEFFVPNNVKSLTKITLVTRDGNSLISQDCFIDTPLGTKVTMKLSCYKQKEN